MARACRPDPLGALAGHVVEACHLIAEPPHWREQLCNFCVGIRGPNAVGVFPKLLRRTLWMDRVLQPPVTPSLPHRDMSPVVNFTGGRAFAVIVVHFGRTVFRFSGFK